MCLILFYQIFAERRGRGKLLAGGTDISALARQIVRDATPQRRVGDEMGGIGGDRPVATGELVLALGAGFDAGQLMLDRVIDRLVVADLEMQERVVLGRAPIAAI